MRIHNFKSLALALLFSLNLLADKVGAPPPGAGTPSTATQFTGRQQPGRPDPFAGVGQAQISALQREQLAKISKERRDIEAKERAAQESLRKIQSDKAKARADLAKLETELDTRLAKHESEESPIREETDVKEGEDAPLRDAKQAYIQAMLTPLPQDMPKPKTKLDEKLIMGKLSTDRSIAFITTVSGDIKDALQIAEAEKDSDQAKRTQKQEAKVRARFERTAQELRAKMNSANPDATLQAARGGTVPITSTSAKLPGDINASILGYVKKRNRKAETGNP